MAASAASSAAASAAVDCVLPRDPREIGVCVGGVVLGVVSCSLSRGSWLKVCYQGFLFGLVFYEIVPKSVTLLTLSPWP